MLRAILILLVAVSAVVAAPPPKGADKKAEVYFPTKVGTKRVYAVTAAGMTTEQTATVTKAEEKDGVWRITEDSDAPAPAPVAVGGTAGMTHDVSEKGLTVVARLGKDLPTPQPLLKLPAKPGDTWDHDPAPANRPAGLPSLVLTYTVGQEEEVETPAGKYKAVPVSSKRVGANGGPAFANTQWYARGVGLIKAVSKVGDRERTMVLKSFTLGK